MSKGQEQGEPVSFDTWYSGFNSFAGKSPLLYSDLHCAWQAAKLYTTPQPKQEPVGYADAIAFDEAMRFGKGCDVWPVKGDYEQRTGRKLRPLYTTPQQRKPLTDEERATIEAQHTFPPMSDSYQYWFFKGVDAAEAAHDIKE